MARTASGLEQHPAGTRADYRVDDDVVDTMLSQRFCNSCHGLLREQHPGLYSIGTECRKAGVSICRTE